MSFERGLRSIHLGGCLFRIGFKLVGARKGVAGGGGRTAVSWLIADLVIGGNSIVFLGEVGGLFFRW